MQFNCDLDKKNYVKLHYINNINMQSYSRISASAMESMCTLLNIKLNKCSEEKKKFLWSAFIVCNLKRFSRWKEVWAVFYFFSAQNKIIIAVLIK